MKKLMLIYPPSSPVLREDRCPVPGGNVVMSPPLPPTDLMYMAAIGEEAGWECRIRDYSAENGGLDDLKRNVEHFEPDLLVVHTTTPTLAQDIQACEAVRKVLPELTIAAKGTHFLRFDREVLEGCSSLDMVIRGEPEMTIRDLLTGAGLESIAGITWRNEGEIIRNPDRPFHASLDDFPLPARHLVNQGLYRRPDTGRPISVVKVSRGCPYHCFFCLATPVSGGTVRFRRPDRIVEELRVCVRDYGIHDFILWSDVFNSNKSWVLDLCSAIRDSELEIRWSANIRADLMDLDMGQAMRGAGCELVSIGIESGNQDMLDRMGKKTSLDLLRRGVEASRLAGLKTLGYYMFGLPWETETTLDETLRFAMKLDTDYASFFVATPLPGTRFFDYAVHEGLIPVDALEENGRFQNAYYGAPVDSGELDARFITDFRGRAMRAYVLRPSYLARKLGRIRSWNEFVNHVRVGLCLLRKPEQGPKE